MKKIVATRLLQAIPLIFIIITINFVIMQLAPGDPVDFLVSGLEGVPSGYLDMVKAKYGITTLSGAIAFIGSADNLTVNHFNQDI